MKRVLEALKAANCAVGTCILALSLTLGLWGVRWCLPSQDRLTRVLPAGLDTPEFRKNLESNWRALHAKLGEDILLHPDSFSYGFDRAAEVEPGWKTPPPILLNSARSAYLRSGHEDEPDILVALSRVRPRQLQLNPRIYFYGGAYMYALGAWVAGLCSLSGTVLTTDVSFYLARPEHMARIYLAGRLFSVLVYALACLFVYFLGKRLWDRATGVWAALFFAASPGIVIQAHYMKPHLLGTLCVMGLFYFCAQILRRDDERLWPWAGVMLGLAAGSAIYMWSSGMLLAFAGVIRAQRRGGAWSSELRGLLRAIGAALVVFFMTNPYLIYEFTTSWEALRRVAAFSAHDPRYLWSFLAVGLPKAVTLPAALWIVAGVSSRKIGRDSARLLALSGLIGHLLMSWTFQSATLLDSVRQFPAAFLGFLLAALRISEWTRDVRWRRLVVSSAAAASVGYACLVSGVMDYNFYLDAAGRSTKRAAGEWIERSIPAGNELGFLRLPQPSNAPYFQWNRYRLKFVQPRVLADWREARSLPEYLVLTCPTYDERPMLRTLLDAHYRIVRRFQPQAWGWIVPPIGEVYANPLVEIYAKRQ